MSGLTVARNILIAPPYNALSRIVTMAVRTINTEPQTLVQKYRNFWNDNPSPQPPYGHCIQIGDPCLRQATTSVPVECIKDKFMQDILKQMRTTLRDYNLVGLSANQIGMSFSILMIEFRLEYARDISRSVYNAKQMEIVPLMVR